MVSKLNCCSLSGMHVSPVELEVDLSNQLPSFALVGMASSVTQESRDRVRAAVTNAGFPWPQKKVTVSLTPADVPKWGAHFELPMALGVLAAQADGPVPTVFAFGEVSLSGALRPTGLGAAILSWFMEQQRSGVRFVLCHAQDWEDYLAWAGGECDPAIEGVTASSLRQLWESFVAALKVERPRIDSPIASAVDKKGSGPDLSVLQSVRGEPLAKLAALVVLADPGRHLLLAGPQGTGKSMVARAMAPAIGCLGPRAAAELGPVCRALGLTLPRSEDRKPVMHLQSSATKAALEGAITANGQVVPGEMSRAHGGMLVMDELLECRRDTIECLRQPLEEGLIRLQRARHRALLPARFQLVATTNLCSCGMWLGENSLCICGDSALSAYQRKLSGPILDRFSLLVLTGQGEGALRGLSGEARSMLDHLVGKTMALLPVSGPTLVENPAQWEAVARLRPEASLRGIRNMAAVAATLGRADGAASPVHVELACALRFPVEKLLKRGRSALPPLRLHLS